MTDWAARFQQHFLAQLKADGASPEQASQWVWQPAALNNLKQLGEGRDSTLEKLTLSPAQAAAAMQQAPAPAVDAAFYAKQKTVLVLVPGFTHETLRNYSWHEQIHRKDSPHHVTVLQPGWNGEAPLEQTLAKGDGLKLLYVRYPRSNAASQHIVPALFAMLRDCKSLRAWVAEGYKLFFVGYSYGAPLSLELLAGLNSGQFKDEFILRNTRGFLGLCGDIGGAYLADDLLKPDATLFNIHQAVAFCRKHPLVAKLAGLGTPQLMDDILGGVESLGHGGRQAAIARYAAALPAQLQYFSISAVMPLADYRRRWWQFNLDDYTMYRQALVTDPITIYNDGQVALADNLVPSAPQIPAENIHHLGAVRTHHWGVSYRTFNLGRNRFPRAAFYRALMQTVVETGLSD